MYGLWRLGQRPAGAGVSGAFRRVVCRLSKVYGNFRRFNDPLCTEATVRDLRVSRSAAPMVPLVSPREAQDEL